MLPHVFREFYNFKPTPITCFCFKDNVVTAMYSATGEEQKTAQEVLTTLKEHPDSWQKVDTILEFSQNQHTKYYALQILESVIKTRWKVRL